MWAALIWLLPIWSGQNQFRKQPGVQGSRTVEIDDRGIRSRWDGGSSDTEWKTYVRSYESRNDVLLYTSPVCFNILPKRAFDAAQLTEFRTLLKDKVAAPK
ncbi:YcxB family protein [Candidatus Korobacter versatilis]|uniref:YcxB family protein n=1 Tax=Candidatus Korobacter versatilis TaxID=658062 RepID=UPI0038CC1DF1